MCHVINNRNERVYAGSFEECREFCRNRSGEDISFVFRDGSTHVIANDSVIATITYLPDLGSTFADQIESIDKTIRLAGGLHE